MIHAFGITAVLAFGKAQFDLIKKIDGTNKALKAVTETSIEFARVKTFLAKTAHDYGLNLLDLTSAYTKFTAATKSSTLSTNELEDIFRSVSKSAAVLGLSAEQVEGTFKALEQMFQRAPSGRRNKRSVG